MPAGPGGLGQQRREAQDPAVDGDVVDLDAAFDQELFDVTVGQAVAQVPADRDGDDLGWEAEAGEGRPRSWSRARTTGAHGPAVSPLGHGHSQRNSPPGHGNDLQDLVHDARVRPSERRCHGTDPQAVPQPDRSQASRRLRQLRQSYFNLDATLIRVLFVVLAVL
jgi:hypothetical protein